MLLINRRLTAFRRAVESAVGKIVIIPFVPGNSTTALLQKKARL